MVKKIKIKRAGVPEQYATLLDVAIEKCEHYLNLAKKEHTTSDVKVFVNYFLNELECNKDMRNTLKPREVTKLHIEGLHAKITGDYNNALKKMLTLKEMHHGHQATRHEN